MADMKEHTWWRAVECAALIGRIAAGNVLNLGGIDVCRLNTDDDLYCIGDNLAAHPHSTNCSQAFLLAVACCITYVSGIMTREYCLPPVP